MEFIRFHYNLIIQESKKYILIIKLKFTHEIIFHLISLLINIQKYNNENKIFYI